MSWIYIVGSVGGVALMVAFCAWLFGTRAIRITSVDVAAERLRNEIAGFRLGEADIAVGENAALVENARDGALHLVVVRGDGLVTRAVKKNALKRLERDGATLALRFSDFTLPRVRLTLADDRVARHWQDRLEKVAV